MQAVFVVPLNRTISDFPNIPGTDISVSNKFIEPLFDLGKSIIGFAIPLNINGIVSEKSI